MNTVIVASIYSLNAVRAVTVGPFDYDIPNVTVDLIIEREINQFVFDNGYPEWEIFQDFDNPLYNW